MSEYTAEMAHAAAARGAAWLDEKCPGWAEHINLDRLHLASPTFCVLGQTAKCLLGEKQDGRAKLNGYGRVLVEMVSKTSDFNVRDLGFNVDFLWPVRRRAAFEMLEIAWREIIRERLGVPA